ncbi:hypothetical protein TRFO_05302 [Tritrichomonas foetus]|uniref:USP domain-containing protein n=1 Tax=Tritrichomonas foetus TaxID=1144522 RepID=A0A1J4K880_9EUKA|nr:hypothetical protein TRFO_05302 [Tritrichomonas foetus]|eukprot:OHT07088.1 hypothetical protein TRFO_05302 [Tritrichomonas foetus]
MIPEEDFESWSLVLQNPSFGGEEYVNFTSDSVNLIFNILSTDFLPDPIENYTFQFINEIIPKSIENILGTYDFSTNVQENIIEYISTVFMLIIWGIGKKNIILFRLLLKIFEKNSPFYSNSENCYETIVDNFTSSGLVDPVLESIQNYNEENALEWFETFFRFLKLPFISFNEAFPSSIDNFIEFLYHKQNDIKNNKDFNILLEIIQSIEKLLFQIGFNQGSTDYHVQKLFPFAKNWIILDNEKKQEIGLSFFLTVLNSMHDFTIESFYKFAKDENLTNLLHQHINIPNLLSQAYRLLLILSEKKDFDFFNSDILLKYFEKANKICSSSKNNDYSNNTINDNANNNYDYSGYFNDDFDQNTFSGIMNDLVSIISNCKVEVINEFIHDLIINHSEKNMIFLLHLCDKVSNNEIIDYFFHYINEEKTVKYFNVLLNKFINDQMKTEIVDKFFNYFMNDYTNANLIKIFPAVVRIGDRSIIQKMLRVFHLNRSLVFRELINKLSMIHEYNITISLPDIKILSQVIDDNFFKFVSKLFSFHGSSIFDEDALQYLFKITKNYNYAIFQSVNPELSDEYILYLLELEKIKRKIINSPEINSNTILFDNYQNIYKLIFKIQNNQSANKLIKLFVHLSSPKFQDEESMKAIIALIQDSLDTISSLDELSTKKYQLYRLLKFIVKLLMKYEPYYLYEYGFEKHNQCEETIKFHIEGLGLDRDFIFPKNLSFYQLGKCLNMYFTKNVYFNYYYKGGYIDERTSLATVLNKENETLKIGASNLDEIPIKYNISLPLSIKLSQIGFQQILLKLLIDEKLGKLGKSILNFLPDDKIIKEEMTSSPQNAINNLRKYLDTNENDEEENNLRRKRFYIIKYKVEILLKEFMRNNQFRKEFRKSGGSQVLFDLLFRYKKPFFTRAIYEAKISKITAEQFKIIIHLYENNSYNHQQSNFLISKLVKRNAAQFSIIFNQCLDEFLEISPKLSPDIQIFFLRNVIPYLTDYLPLFNSINKDLEIINKNEYVRKLFSISLSKVRDSINYNKISMAIFEQFPRESSKTIKILSKLSPTEETIINYYSTCLFDSKYVSNSYTSEKKNISNQVKNEIKKNWNDDKIKLIFKFFSNLPAKNIENHLLPHFLFKIDRWNYDPDYDSKSITGFCGLRNLGATCYFNSVLQILFFTKPFCKFILHSEKDVELRKLFAEMLLTNRKFADTSKLTAAWKGWDSKPINPREQQDAFEFFQMFIDKLPNECNSFFKGQFVNEFKGLDENSDFHSDNLEEFVAIPLVISECDSLNESFANFAKPDLLTDDNQIFVESFNKKIDAQKYIRIEEAPQFLVIHLKRFEYNIQTGVRDKITKRYEFKQLINIKELMKNQQDTFYELYGLILHSGTAHSGHYTSLVRINTSWILFNDSEVEFFCDSNSFNRYIDNAAFGKGNIHDPVAYILFYRKIDDSFMKLESTDFNSNNLIFIPPPSFHEKVIEFPTNNFNHSFAMNTKNVEYEFEFNKLNSLIQNEDRQEIEDENNQYSKIRCLFSSYCLDFIRKTESQKLKLAYLINILGHSREFANFHGYICNQLLNKNDNIDIRNNLPININKEVDNDLSNNDEGNLMWIVSFLNENANDVQDIILHSHEVSEFSSFLINLMEKVSVHISFPFFDSFVSNLSKVSQLWRKIDSYTFIIFSFIANLNQNESAIQIAQENDWLKKCVNFVNDFYSKNTSKIPLEGVNLSYIFMVIQKLIKKEKENKKEIYQSSMFEEMIKNFEYINQSMNHTNIFYNLLITSYPYISCSPSTFSKYCKQRHICYQFFDKVITHSNMQISNFSDTFSDLSPNLLLDFFTHKINDSNPHPEIRNILLENYKYLIIPNVFLLNYSQSAEILLYWMFSFLKLPKERLFPAHSFEVINWIDSDLAKEKAKLVEIFESLLHYAVNIKNDDTSKYFIPFAVISGWVIGRLDLLDNVKYMSAFDEILNTKKLTQDECIGFYLLLMKYPFDVLTIEKYKEFAREIMKSGQMEPFNFLLKKTINLPAKIIMELFNNKYFVNFVKIIITQCHHIKMSTQNFKHLLLILIEHNHEDTNELNNENNNIFVQNFLEFLDSLAASVPINCLLNILIEVLIDYMNVNTASKLVNYMISLIEIQNMNFNMKKNIIFLQNIISIMEKFKNRIFIQNNLSHSAIRALINQLDCSNDLCKSCVSEFILLLCDILDISHNLNAKKTIIYLLTDNCSHEAINILYQLKQYKKIIKSLQKCHPLTKYTDIFIKFASLENFDIDRALIKIIKSYSRLDKKVLSSLVVKVHDKEKIAKYLVKRAINMDSCLSNTLVFIYQYIETFPTTKEIFTENLQPLKTSIIYKNKVIYEYIFGNGDSSSDIENDDDLC